VMKDLHKYRHLPGVLHQNNQFFTSYPELVNHAAKTLFTVDGADKASKELDIRSSFRASRSLMGLMSDAYKLWRATR